MRAVSGLADVRHKLAHARLWVGTATSRAVIGAVVVALWFGAATGCTDGNPHPDPPALGNSGSGAPNAGTSGHAGAGGGRAGAGGSNGGQAGSQAGQAGISAGGRGGSTPPSAGAGGHMVDAGATDGGLPDEDAGDDDGGALFE